VKNNRECGSCTLCCKMLYVKDYNSPIGKYCKNCNPNQGCKIHEERKEICRTFDCLWIKQTQIPESYRPDRCHFLFELPSHSLVYFGHVDTDYPETFNSEKLKNIIKKINEAGHSVVLNNGEFHLTKNMTEKELFEDLNYTFQKNHENGNLQVKT